MTRTKTGSVAITVTGTATDNYKAFGPVTITLTVTKDGSLSAANFELVSASPKYAYDYDKKAGIAQPGTVNVKNTG